MTAVTIENVKKVYGGREASVHALGPISAELRQGETVAIVGPSGCGKSTLLRIIAGLDDPSTGRVTVGGTPVKGPVSNVGIVFQRDLLLDWRNILDNVLLPAEYAGLDVRSMTERAHDLLRQLGVGDFARRYPWELSGGMRQRVSIARAMLCNPSMLLLDEPFSALDAMTRDQMGVILQNVQASQSMTTLLITHSIPEAVFLSDRVLVMSGRPGLILDEIPVSFPRPRRLAFREDPAFAALTRRIRLHFERAGVLVG